MSRCLTLFVVSVLVFSGQLAPAESPSPGPAKIRALLICGGCCHDYQNQKRIISQGLSSRIDGIEWTILEYSKQREVKADVYRHSDWIDDFDIVIHNECFGAVKDGEFVKGIVDAHVTAGVPAIVIHCSMHSYRAAPTADVWRAFLGVTSRRHERGNRSLRVVPTKSGSNHPILAAIGDQWDTPNGELYIIEKVWPGTDVLATVHSDETGKEEPVIWTNRYKGVRVFGITIGHHNETMEDDLWQSIVAAGWTWALEE